MSSRLRGASLRVLLGVLGAFLLLGLELGLVAWLGRARITGGWELQQGSLRLFPLFLLLAVPAGVVGSAFWALALRGDARPWRLVAAGAVALGATLVGWGVGGGRHLATLELRLGFALLVGLLAGSVAFLALPALRRLLEGPRWLSVLVLGACIVLLELANQMVLVRLYPAFHWGLSAGALIIAAMLAQQGLPASGYNPRWQAAWLALGSTLGLVGLLVAVPSAKGLAGFDNFKLLVFEGGPSARHAVLLGAWLAPPESLADCGEGCEELASAPGSGAASSLDLRGRSLLLVTIDALRADHVGAYGYARDTTPALDRLAQEGTVFAYAYAPTPHTSYSLTSLMTGKYLRPLLRQGMGADSATWAELQRLYGFRTAAFYPPAVFFIDPEQFEPFQRKGLGFEYQKVEFAEGQKRLGQVQEYLEKLEAGPPVFLWVHLFGPHEPYERHPEHDFGAREIDRYDSEIAAADATVGRLVELIRGRDPKAVVVVTADHGEEFGEHGGRYHGTTVYEEQVRVPLVIHIPGHPGAGPGVPVPFPVQTIDLLPTFLALQKIPIPPRVRGTNLASWLGHSEGQGDYPGLALAETDDQLMLAEGSFRLVCARRLGACALYDILKDPLQRSDIQSQFPDRAAAMRQRSRALGGSHGRFEQQTPAARAWPEPIARALSGDGDTGEELARLLTDPDPAVRRAAAEQLFELPQPASVEALRLALRRDQDLLVRRWAALALSRQGEAVPLVSELLRDPELSFRRVSALALAEQGDARGRTILVEWWQDSRARDYRRSLQLLSALGQLREKKAVGPLTRSLGDVRLRPHIAKALAAIGDRSATGPLLSAFAEERYQHHRVALAEALVALRAGNALAPSLTRFLGVPDPLANGLWAALESGSLEYTGGPKARDLGRLREQAELGVAIQLVVPARGNGQGVRAVLRARANRRPGVVRLSTGLGVFRQDAQGRLVRSAKLPRVDPERSLVLEVPEGEAFREVYAQVPEEFGIKPGQSCVLVVHADPQVELLGLALVPLAEELPPPAPEPWQKKPEPSNSAGPEAPAAHSSPKGDRPERIR